MIETDPRKNPSQLPERDDDGNHHWLVSPQAATRFGLKDKEAIRGRPPVVGVPDGCYRVVLTPPRELYERAET